MPSGKKDKGKKPEESNHPKSNYYRSHGYKVKKSIVLYDPYKRRYVNSADIRAKERAEEEKRAKQKRIEEYWYRANYNYLNLNSKRQHKPTFWYEAEIANRIREDMRRFHRKIRASRQAYYQNLLKKAQGKYKTKKRRYFRRKYLKRKKTIRKKVSSGHETGDTWRYIKKKDFKTKKKEYVNYLKQDKLLKEKIFRMKALLDEQYGPNLDPSAAGNAFAQQSARQLHTLYCNIKDSQLGFYLGKCQYSYEIVNPTNYNLYVDLYDLVARRDWLNQDPATQYRSEIHDENPVNAPTETKWTQSGSNAPTSTNTPINTSITYPGVPYPEACIYYGNTYLDNLMNNSSVNANGQPGFPSITTTTFPSQYASDYRVRISENFYDDIYNESSNIAKWNSIGINPTGSRSHYTSTKIIKYSNFSWVINVYSLVEMTITFQFIEVHLLWIFDTMIHIPVGNYFFCSIRFTNSRMSLYIIYLDPFLLGSNRNPVSFLLLNFLVGVIEHRRKLISIILMQFSKVTYSIVTTLKPWCTFFTDTLISSAVIPAARCFSSSALTYAINIKDSQLGFYLGKCQYSYEIVNPTNYNLYVDLYDLVAKRDWLNQDPASSYRSQINDANPTNKPTETKWTQSGTNAPTSTNTPVDTSIQYPGVPYPEACIYYGNTYLDNLINNYTASTAGLPNPPNITSTSYSQSAANYRVRIGENFYDDPYDDSSNIAKWNSIGINPTGSRYFNELWKVKKKVSIVLGPNAIYKHTQTIKLGKILDRANFFYRYPSFIGRQQSYNMPGIIGGLTTSLLIRAYGQLASENNITETAAVSSGIKLEGNDVFNLPASLLIRRNKKENIFYGRYSVPIYKTVTDKLKNNADMGKVRVITNMDEKAVEFTTDAKDDGYFKKKLYLFFIFYM
eukprot:jgi/Orpsp1_1/1187899/evm.model.d7180000061014.2